MIEIKIPEDLGMIRATIQYLSELDAKLTDGGLFNPAVSYTVGDTFSKKGEQFVVTGITPLAEPTNNEGIPLSQLARIMDDSLDVDGKEWDERIHASTRTKTQDGRWKMKRGVDKALVEEVGKSPTQNNESTPPPPVAPIIEETPPPPPPPAEPTAKEWTFVTLVEAITANKIPLEKVQEVAANWGVTRFPMLNTEQYKPLCANIAADLGLV